MQNVYQKGLYGYSFRTFYNFIWFKFNTIYKVWPNIPTEDNFRPVVVLSAMYKFMELRFLPKLQNYLSLRLDKNQTGFVPKLGTQVNILSLTDEINRLKGKIDNAHSLLYVDYSTAYNTVVREKIYDLMI